MIPSPSNANVLDSGTAEVPPISRSMFLRPLELSEEGSALRKSSVVDVPVAVNPVLNCCHANPVAVLLLVNFPSSVPLSRPKAL